MHRLACWRLCYCDISAACSVLFALLIALSPLVAGVDLEEVAAFLFANLFLTLGIGMAEEIFFRGIICNLWLKYGVIKAMPLVEKPKKYAEYAGPPAFLCNNYAMFLLSPMFEPIMGMEPATIYSMVPVNDRKDGGYWMPQLPILIWQGTLANIVIVGANQGIATIDVGLITENTLIEYC